MTSDGSGTGTFTSMLTGLEPGTNYYVRAYASNMEGTAYGNQRSFRTTGGLFTVVFNVDLSYVIGWGPMEIFDPAVHTVYITGSMIEWAEPLNRLVEVVDQDIVVNNYWGDVDDVGEYFTLDLLVEPVGAGIVYGAGNYLQGDEYPTIAIGSQEWMVNNLRVTRYGNGDQIPTGLTGSEWQNTTEGAYSIYDHNHQHAHGINSSEEMAEIYGFMYNWYVANDPFRTPPHLHDEA